MTVIQMRCWWSETRVLAQEVVRCAQFCMYLSIEEMESMGFLMG